MNRIIGAIAHPSDGDLVRFLDNELSELEERRTQSHFRECDECRARADVLARHSRTVSRYVAGLEVDAGDMVARARAQAAVRRANAAREHHRRRGVAVRAASVAALVIALAVGIQPLRAWVLDRLSDLRGGAGAPEAMVAPPPAAPVHRSSVIAFAPQSASFELRIERTQEVGSLIVEVRAAERGSAQILDGGEETLLVLPSGLRIENGAGSRASYVVTLPADLPLLQVTIGNRTIATLRPGQMGTEATRTFSLQDPGAAD